MWKEESPSVSDQCNTGLCQGNASLERGDMPLVPAAGKCATDIKCWENVMDYKRGKTSSRCQARENG